MRCRSRNRHCIYHGRARTSAPAIWLWRWLARWRTRAPDGRAVTRPAIVRQPPGRLLVTRPARSWLASSRPERDGAESESSKAQRAGTGSLTSAGYGVDGEHGDLSGGQIVITRPVGERLDNVAEVIGAGVCTPADLPGLGFGF